MPATTQSIYDEIYAQLQTYGLESLATRLTQLITEYGVDMKETIKTQLRQTDEYRQRFAGNDARRTAGLQVLSESEYLYNERAYNETLRSYGMGDLATRTNYAQFIGGDVSPVELQQRFSMAVDKVNKADPALKRQLNQMYPGISDRDLARSLLMGTEGSQFLKTRLGQAEILAEASTAGITLQNTAADLEAQGVTREDAAKGLSKISQQRSGYEQASRIYGEDVDPQGLQRELEAENLLGQTSTRTKRLASQARGAFSGQSGIQTGSLSRKKSGQI
jgi:hypothetical protein